MLSNKSFFNVSSFAHSDLFQPDDYAWTALKNLKAYMDEQSYPDVVKGPIRPAGEPLIHTLALWDDSLVDNKGLVIEFGDATKDKMKVYKDGQLLEGASVIMAGAVLMGDRIRIGKGVLIEAGALIKAPTILGDKTEVRQGAYMRGYCLVGKRCVVGHVTEVKKTIFLNDAKAGHFAYLGDSIIGNQSNLGAGTKLANLRFTGGEVAVKTAGGSIKTGLTKMGAIFGDQVQTGCNSVTNPGTMLGKKSLVLPNTTTSSGYHRNNSIIR